MRGKRMKMSIKIVNLLFAILVGLTVVKGEKSGKSKCNDLDSRCSKWAAKGECEKSVKFMKRNCRRSCMLCEEAVLEAIVDNAGRQTLYMTVLLVGLIGGLCMAALRAYFAGGSCGSLAKLYGKTVIVTGANSGIGRETALSFAGRGAKVILACRNFKRGLQAMKYIRDISGSKLVEFRKLDLSSFTSIREFAREFNEEEERLDILVNNAGILSESKRELTKDGHEMMLQTNYLGAFLLTNLLLDKLKHSAPSRIINVSCSAYENSKGFDFKNMEMETNFDRFKQLAQTKLAMILFTNELSKRLEESKVAVNAVNPGCAKTNFMKNIKLLQFKIVKMIVFPIQAFCCKTARQGAQTSIYVSVAKELDGMTGKYFTDCKEKEPASFAKDDGAAKKLWEITERYTKLT